MFGFTQSDARYEKAARDPEAALALLQKLKSRRKFASGIAIGSAILILLSVLISFLIAGGMTNGAGLKHLDFLEQVIGFLRILVPILIGSCVGSVFIDQNVKMLILATGSSHGNSAPDSESGKSEARATLPPKE